MIRFACEFQCISPRLELAELRYLFVFFVAQNTAAHPSTVGKTHKSIFSKERTLDFWGRGFCPDVWCFSGP